MYKINKDYLNKAHIIFLALILLFGIFLRVKVYLFNISFWGDESALALNIINRNFIDLLKPLDYTQCAPYGFLILTKLITKFFGTSEYTFRFIPFLASILSIPAFYFLSKKVLNKKWSILIANYLFAVNFHLIYYAQEFKQYSTEVLTTILLILFLSKKLNSLKTLTIKQCILITLVFVLSVLFSLPSLFILAAFILYLIYENKAQCIKQIISISIPFSLFIIPYYLFCLYPSKKTMLFWCNSVWYRGFIEFNYASIKYVVVQFFNYSFGSNYNPIPALILILITASFAFKNKNKVLIIIFFTFLMAIFASICHIYPILGRLHLCLTPLVILIMIKPFDLLNAFSLKNMPMCVLLMALSFYCFKTNFVKNIIKLVKNDNFTITCIKEQTKFIKDNSAPNDIFMFVDDRTAAYFYYLKYFNVQNSLILIPKYSDLTKEYLDNLSKGQIFWFYYDACFTQSFEPVSIVKKWAYENKDVIILLENELNNPYHFYLLKFKIEK